MDTVKSVGKLQRWSHFLGHSVWLEAPAGVSRLNEIRFKITPGAVLAILKGYSAEGPVVAFIGARSLVDLHAKLGTKIALEGLKWRPDRFALDDLEKNG